MAINQISIRKIVVRDGIFEDYCSKGYFEEKYGLNADVLYQRAVQKDKIAFAIYEQYGQDAGNPIKVIMFVADLEIIVINGSMAKAFPFFKMK